MLSICEEPYKIQSDLCGLKLSVGPFRCEWRVTDSASPIRNYEPALIVSFSLRMEEFDGDVAERSVAEIAGDMGEAAPREVRFAILENQMNFGFVANGVDNVSGAQRNIDVVVIVLVKLRVFVRRHFDVVDADILVFDPKVMVWFAGNTSVRQRSRLRRLRAEGESKNEQS